MKMIKTRMRLLIILLFPTIIFAQGWLRLPDFPSTRRDDGVSVVVGNQAYFGTGLQDGWGLTIDFHALNIDNFTWSSISTMPHTTERQYANAFPGPGSFYVFGGEGPATVLNNMYRYNIATDTWSEVASKPGAGVMASVCMVFGDKVIIAGGKIAGAGPATNEVWEYTISTDSWIQKANYPFSPRWRSSSAVMNNSGFLLFGIDDSNAYRKELYKYDPVNDTWSHESDFPGDGRSYAAMEANNRLIVFGGHAKPNTYLNDVWYYNDNDGTWTQGVSLPAPARRTNMSCLKDEKFIVSCGLGEGDIRLNETWLIDVPVGIEKVNAKKSYHLFPNPVSEELHVVAENDVNRIFRLTDLSGREIPTKQSISDSGILFDLSDVPVGIYILTCYENGRKAGMDKVIRR
jgi:N-acetylneuraminic acid mutarotase